MPKVNEIPSNLVPWATDNGSGKVPAQCEYTRDNNDNGIVSDGDGTYIIRADFYRRLPGEILATQAGVATLHTIRHTAGLPRR